MTNQVLKIERLCKEYPKFQLQDVSFHVGKGEIMGFIGRNGAGKTTTLKSIMNLVHPSAGNIEFFGLNFAENEKEIKGRIGYAIGGVNYYQQKRIKDISAVTKTFYENWDNEAYRHYLDYFSLDEDKKLKELSEGMKVKFHLTLALSHHAEFLILDEPTSGLDPVSREELLEVFLDIAVQGVAILFSTHITSDLEKCADSITYIRDGRIISSGKIKDFTDSYRLLEVDTETLTSDNPVFIGVSRSKSGSTALIHTEDAGKFVGKTLTTPDLQTIMVHLEK